jgi:hypothetical protein
MIDETPRAGDLCRECGTPLEVSEVSDEREPSQGATLVLRCANGHATTVHRHARSGDDAPAA